MGNDHSSGLTHHREGSSRKSKSSHNRVKSKHQKPATTATTTTMTTTNVNNNNNNNNKTENDNRMDTTPIEDSSGEIPKQKIVQMEPSCQTFTGGEQAHQAPWKTKLHPASKSSSSGSTTITDALTDVRISYHINPKEIGHGHYGVVRKCMHRDTKQWYAIKSIRKSKVSKVEVLKREIQILQEINHPNIIELKEVHEDKKYLHLVTELCTGGELFDRIIAKTQSPEGHFSEYDAASLIYDILDAIEYCHDVKGIVHRDLKPENFLFQTEDEHSPIKIIDFGLSRHDDTAASIMKTKVGTPYYVAPEVLKREYTKSCDIWSIGVITYILLCGYPPFYGDSDNEIFNSVRIGRFDFPSPEWDTISAKAKQFICTLLKKNPSERLTASEAKQHAWLVEQLGPHYEGSQQQSREAADGEKVVSTNHEDTTITSQDMEEETVQEGTSTELHDDSDDENDPTTGTTTSTIESEQSHTGTTPATAARRRSSSIILLDSDRSQTYQKFMGMQKLKKAALAHIATHLTHSEVGELGDIFQQMDKDGDGTLTLQDLDAALVVLAQQQQQQQSQQNTTTTTPTTMVDGNEIRKKSSLIQDLEDLRMELQLCDQSTLHWKEFLAATMDKNLALREDKVRMAFDHFRHAPQQSSNTTSTNGGLSQESLDHTNGGGGEFSSTTNSSDPEQQPHNYLAVQDLIELFGGESQAKEIMGFVDVDGDGRISFEEFRNAIQESMIMNDVSGNNSHTGSNDNTPPTSHHHATNPPQEND